MAALKTILLIDDDPDDCGFFCEAVLRIDYKVHCVTAINGEDALKLLHNAVRDLPDFIFLDLNMPRMDGKTCLVELKKDELLKHIPVVIFTTSSDPKDKKETRELGAAHFITKPYDLKELCDKINFVLSED